MYDELFAFCSLEDAKVVSKSEREEHELLEQKVGLALCILCIFVLTLHRSL
jgi:hypothetical protein